MDGDALLLLVAGALGLCLAAFRSPITHLQCSLHGRAVTKARRFAICVRYIKFNLLLFVFLENYCLISQLFVNITNNKLFNIYTVIKKNSYIASLFQKHQAKKGAATASASNHSPDPVERVVEEQNHERIEEISHPMPPPPPQPSSPPLLQLRYFLS